MSIETFIYSFMHIMAVVVLMGGGIFNAWILDPTAEKALSPPDSGKLGMAIGKAWVVTAWLSIVVILVTGTLLTERAERSAAMLCFTQPTASLLLPRW